uniref:GTPase rho n=1 Tax=Riptortus pedestris TaxID=329032 RepID=R4WDE7_RIPPE|nr:GTPase rho [Riptortus pedestris]
MEKKRLTIVGDAAVGKSSLIRSFMKIIMNAEYIPPVIIDDYSLVLEVRGDTKLLLINDTLSSRYWSKLKGLIYPETDAVMIVFDITSTDSLSNVTDHWFPEVSSYCPNVPIILVGNKKDLRKGDDDKVDYTERKAKAKRIGARDYIECSAITMEGIPGFARRNNNNFI